MNAWLRCCIAWILLAASSAPIASFHLFRIEQVFSNADGSPTCPTAGPQAGVS